MDREMNWAAYDPSGDEPFLPKNIYTAQLYAPGILPGEAGGFLCTDRTDIGAFVLKGEYGKCYEVKIAAGCGRICAFRTEENPRAAEAMTIAVENYINFIIQNALFFLQEERG